MSKKFTVDIILPNGSVEVEVIAECVYEARMKVYENFRTPEKYKEYFKHNAWALRMLLEDSQELRIGEVYETKFAGDRVRGHTEKEFIAERNWYATHGR